MRENDRLNEKIEFLTSELNHFYPQHQQHTQHKFNEINTMNPSEIPRGGFIKKKQVGENFDNILQDLNESEVK